MFEKIKSWYKKLNANQNPSLSQEKGSVDGSTNDSTNGLNLGWGIDIEPSVSTQSTPNPNAKKFILNAPVKSSGKVSYEDPGKCEHIPLVKSIFMVPGIKRVHLSGEFITITKKTGMNWQHIERPIKELILEMMADHNPDFDEKKMDMNRPGAVELTLIEGILDRTVRPYLQSDGGDLELLSYIDQVLMIRFEGACGGCPSAEAGTLNAIVGVLRDEFNPDIDVVTV